jgi:hypothetical protein
MEPDRILPLFMASLEIFLLKTTPIGLWQQARMLYCGLLLMVWLGEMKKLLIRGKSG